MKTSHQRLEIKLFSQCGMLLYRDYLDRFPFPEDVILAYSLRFFSDPSPCEIHRRAVQIRLAGELETELPHEQNVPFSQIPQAKQSCFIAFPEAISLYLSRGGGGK